MMKVAGGIEESECVLTAAQYRRLWLDEAHTLGQVAETLADVLGWQRSEDDPLPDALELAQVAAARITTLEQSLALYQPRLRARAQAEKSYRLTTA